MTVTTTAVGWRAMAKEITTARAEYRANRTKMSRYEAEKIAREFDSMKARYQPRIEAEAIAEWKAAVDKFSRAKQRANTAWVKENISWDIHKLNDEAEYYRRMIEAEALRKNTAVTGDTAAQALRDIWEDAQRSGDKYKIRAAAEILQTAVAKFNNAPLEIRAKIDSLGQEARREIATIRVTDELRVTHAEKDNAWNELQAIRAEMERAHTAIFEREALPFMPMGNIERALNMVQIDDKGEPVILPPWHPDVRLENPPERKS